MIQWNEESASLKPEISSLKMQLFHSKARIKQVWCNSCECLARRNTNLALRDAKIDELKLWLHPSATHSECTEELITLISTTTAEPKKRA